MNASPRAKINSAWLLWIDTFFSFCDDIQKNFGLLSCSTDSITNPTLIFNGWNQWRYMLYNMFVCDQFTLVILNEVLNYLLKKSWKLALNQFCSLDKFASENKINCMTRLSDNLTLICLLCWCAFFTWIQFSNAMSILTASCCRRPTYLHLKNILLRNNMSDGVQIL